MKKLKICFLLAFIMAVKGLTSSNYYVSPSGKAPSNLTVNSVFTSLSQLYRSFSPGDTIFFEEGQTFSGQIALGREASGTKERPVVFCTYGTKPAVINAGSMSGIKTYNTGGLVFDNFEIKGIITTNEKQKGLDFYTDQDDAKVAPVRFSRLNVHDFYQVAQFGNWDYNFNGYENIVITDSKLHHAKAGFETYDYGTAGPFAHDSIYMSNCEIYEIHNTDKKGSGAVFSGLAKGLIEYCYVHDCSGSGGLCMWTYACSNVVTQYCIFSDYRSTGKDGGGFDIDGGSTNCIVQHCYSYNNDGMGAMVCDYDTPNPTTGNIIRHCISENDCRRNSVESAFGFVNWGSGISNSYIYNNTVYLEQKTGSSTNRSGLGFQRLKGYAYGDVSNCKIFNNLVYLKGNNLLYVDNNLSGTGSVEYWGNCYYSENGSKYRDGSTTYATLDEWRAGKQGQEKTVDGLTGMETNPLLYYPGGGDTLKLPSQLKAMNAYVLQSNSPCIEKGIDPQKYFSLKACNTDFLGNATTTNGKYSIGACMYKAGLSIDKKADNGNSINIYPNPCNGVFFIEYEGLIDNSYALIFDMSGHQLKRIPLTSQLSTIDIKDLSKGIFIVCIESKGFIVSKSKLLSY